VNLTVCTAIAVAVAGAADLILAFYGPEYRDGAATLRISVLTGVVIAAQQPLAAYLVAACNMWLVTLSSAAWAVAFFGASYALLGYGAVGMATARLAGYAVYAALVIALAIQALRRTITEPRSESPGILRESVATPWTTDTAAA
jgi:O-antigen/teichoic acid export membrane protein